MGRQEIFTDTIRGFRQQYFKVIYPELGAVFGVVLPGTINSEVFTQVGIRKVAENTDGIPGRVFPEPGYGEMVGRVVKGDVNQVAFQGVGFFCH